MMKRLIVLTTPTSGTTSLWRILNRYLPVEMPRGWFIDDCLARGVPFEEIKYEKLPEEGCFLFNQPHLFNFDQDFKDTKFILNFRDPRDMSCNQYYWVFSHPAPQLSEEQQRERQERIKSMGIDAYVLSLDHRSLFSSHLEFLRRQDLLEKSISVSYIQLCFDTDGVVERLANLLCFEDRKIISDSKLVEHPSALVGSNAWIGGKWSGADVFPGRARVELKSDTYKKLTDKYADILKSLKSLDDVRYSYFYS